VALSWGGNAPCLERGWAAISMLSLADVVIGGFSLGFAGGFAVACLSECFVFCV
jgi:hypothetical protein